MRWLYTEFLLLCTNMKPYSSWIHSVLIVLSILYISYLHYKLLEVNRLFSGVISSMHPKPSIPYNLYVTEQPYDLSTIFTVIGVIFGLFSFLTFQSIKDFYESKIKEVKKEHEKARNQYNKQEHKLIELENNIIEFSICFS